MRSMTKIAVLVSSSLFGALGVSQSAYAVPVFINEIHYDNSGTDTGEAIEIAGPAGTDLSGWSVVLYNGSNGSIYDTSNLSGTLADLGDGFGTVEITYPSNGIQNGSPDGIALVDNSGAVQQFLSYEGTLTAVGGPADGMVSTDIGVAESSSTAIGLSLQLAGSGSVYEDFSWSNASASTFNNVNAAQSFGGDVTPPPPVSMCGDEATLISAIQGNGDTSPLIGEKHSVEAIVVADFQSSGSFGGFYLQEQEADYDADPMTSEGLFVSSTATDVEVGDVVHVVGVVAESYGLTSLTSVTNIQVCSTGASVEATEFSLPFNFDDNSPEWIEGMLVTLPQQLTVTETYDLARYGEIVVSSNGRLFNPTHIAEPGEAANEQKALNDLNRLIIDDGMNDQNPDPVIFPAPELSADNSLRNGSTVTGATGVMSYAFSNYRLQPTQTPLFENDNPRTAEPTELSKIGSLRVASFNVLNFFNGDGLGGGFPTARGADTASELVRQKDKIVAAIAAIDADVVGLMEIENDGYDSTSAIAELVDALNTIMGAGTYAYVNPGVSAIGTDEIAVGMIYKPAKVALEGDSAILDASVDARFVDDKNRPTLAQTVRDLASNKTLTIAVNHLKSKGSDCDALGDPDQNDGQGNCNLTRTDAANAMADWLALDPTQSNSDNFLIIGDLNSYAMEDPITALKDSGYTNLLSTFMGDDAYSYVFKGEFGYLDHALSSATLTPQVTAATEWHINSDEPRALDYNEEYKSDGQVASFYNADPYRSSDHDPVVVQMLIPGDLNNDGKVGRADFKLLKRKLRSCEGSRRYLAEADYDNSGCIKYRDLRIWRKHQRHYRRAIK